MDIRELVNTVRRDGACVTTSKPDMWFRGEPRGRVALEVQRRYARQTCESCPVRRECLMLALSYEAEAGVSWGIWGGVCARDRETAILDAKETGPEDALDLPGIADQLLSWAAVDERACPTGGLNRKRQAGTSRRQCKSNHSRTGIPS